MHAKRLLAVFAILSAVSCGRSQLSDSIESSLVDLDGYLASRSVYEARKRDQLEALRKLLNSSTEPSKRYEMSLELAGEYFSYNFDSTQFYLYQSIQIAREMGDRELSDGAVIALGHLYAKSGHFMEAYRRLYEQVDTSMLSPALRADYLFTLYDFSRDLAGNSGMAESLSVPDRSEYAEELLALLPADSEKCLQVRIDRLVQEGKMESADSLCRILLARTDPNVHKYAIYVKDYASLTMVAQNLLQTDLDRSFRYLRIAQEDALAYNAKLRPWQISLFFMEIENAYADRQSKVSRAMYVVSILFAILTLILSLLAFSLRNRSRKLSRTRAELEGSNMRLGMANATLNDLNARLSKADKIKEDFIVGFLHQLSENVAGQRAEDNRMRNLLKQNKSAQLLRELDLSSRSEKSLKEYYRTFDTTFLGLYPDFVEQFNALLKEESRFNLKEGTLNTELRIFALIRLGIDDSREIASILHYSLSTIYNYKVSVKNACLGDRDDFENRVKKIGK